MTISPYELLRASKPQPPQSVVTPYDLYSRIQQKEPAYRQDSISPVPPPAPSERACSAAAAPAVRRTHYISDIHAKHSTADRRASFVSRPIHEQEMPPAQQTTHP